MQLRGNYVLFFWIEVMAGVLTLLLTRLYGDWGLLGALPFFIGLVVTQKKNPDEREMQLVYRAQAMESIPTAAVLGLIYFLALPWNWFHALVSVSMISRGTFGLFSFLKS